MTKDKVPFFVSRILGWRPARWAQPLGDYDGRDRTLQVFNVDVRARAQLLAEIDRHRKVIEEAAGGPLVFILHSVNQTDERYADFARAFPRPLRSARQEIGPPPEQCVDVQDKNGPHRRAA